MTDAPADRLAPILARRREDVAAAQAARPLIELEQAIDRRAPAHGFARAIAGPGLQIIAEIKRRSPSAGDLSPDAAVADIARSYAANGAAALSILTEPHFFGGALEDLVAARGATDTPLLRKDFVVDRWQLAEARVAGADAALLIVAALGGDTAAFVAAGKEYDLDLLVEAHDEAELEIAIDAGAQIIGLNNRSLATLEIDLGVTERLRRRVPDGVITVAESGVETADDLRRLAACGVHAVLIGSTLMRDRDPGAALRRLIDAAAPG